MMMIIMRTTRSERMASVTYPETFHGCWEGRRDGCREPDVEPWGTSVSNEGVDVYKGPKAIFPETGILKRR